PFDSRDAAVRIGCSPIRLTPSTVRTFSSQHAPRFASRVTPQCSTRSSPTTILEAGSPIERQQNLNSQQDIISSLPTSTIIQSFPELAFIHLSSFSGIAGSFEHVQRRNHIAAILSLCADLLPSTTPNLQSPETYAKYTREGLSRLVINPPSITVVQTLLTIAMYDWGNGNGYGAWMYGGIATRMMQSIQVLKRDRNYSERERETQNRTFWACFVMDRLIFCGKSQTLLLPMERMTIHLPVGDLDFTFGESSNIRYTNLDIAKDPIGLELHNTIDHQYSVLVRGSDICAKVLEFISSGGRRQPEMSEPDKCPWRTTSPWNFIYENLEKWRSLQCRRLQYPLSPVATHVSLGNGESFAYINLLYYVCILFLNREYIPFLPSSTSKPQGPIDPPLLKATSPDNWWSERAADLFHAAKCITTILDELNEVDSPLITPFAGFCAFSAATMNLYVAAFPQMNLGRSKDATALAEHNIAYLDKFRQIWKIGAGWWKTIEQTRSLYTHAMTDRSLFKGKTRVDFEALEASIHDYSGASSVEEVIQEFGPPMDPGEVDDGDQAAAISLQELSSAGIHQQRNLPEQTQPREIDDPALAEYGIWNEVWPMWGEQQLLSFAPSNAYEFNSEFHPIDRYNTSWLGLGSVSGLKSDLRSH
ncbi:putative transcriptional regulatory protein, partial [Lachnellula cervina]